MTCLFWEKVALVWDMPFSWQEEKKLVRLIQSVHRWYIYIISAPILFFKLINLFIYYLFLAVLDLHCCAQAFSSCSERGLLFAVVCGLLIAVASLVAEHGL